LLDDVAYMDYETMFMKQKREGPKERVLINALKEETGVEREGEDKYAGLTEEEKNKKILHDVS